MSLIANANFAAAINHKGADAFFVGVLAAADAIHNLDEVAAALLGNDRRDFMTGATTEGETHEPSLLAAMQAVYK